MKVKTGALCKKIVTNADNEMTSLEFSDGTTLEADMVLMATGVLPET